MTDRKNTRRFLTACSAIAAPALAQDAPATDAPAPAEPESNLVSEGALELRNYSGSFWEREYLLGDPGGVRSGLADRGIHIDVDWVQHIQTVAEGGVNEETRYGGTLDYNAVLDLERAGLITGATVRARGESRYGDSVNDITRAVLPVNTDFYFPALSPGRVDEGVPIALTELVYEQEIFPGFSVFGGKLYTLGWDPNEFASGRGITQFNAAEFNFNPVVALTLPVSSLGFGIKYEPNENIAITAAVMNTEDTPTTPGFKDIGAGWTINLEVVTRYELGSLPGGQNFGLIYAGDQELADLSGRFDFDPTGGRPILPEENNSWSLYWSGWQYLWTDGEGEGPIDLDNGIPDRRGFGLFARAGLGDDETVPFDWSLSAGVGGRGLIPGRPDDVFGAGYFYSNAQPGLITSTSAIDDEVDGVEAFYNIAITPGARLTFNFQAINDADASTERAIIFGSRLQLRF